MLFLSAYFAKVDTRKLKPIWVKAFKNRPSKTCGRQALKNLKWYDLSITWPVSEYLDPFVVQYTWTFRIDFSLNHPCRKFGVLILDDIHLTCSWFDGFTSNHESSFAVWKKIKYYNFKIQIFFLMRLSVNCLRVGKSKQEQSTRRRLLSYLVCKFSINSTALFLITTYWFF